MKPEEMIGKTYGRLTILRYLGKNKRYAPLFECQCSCENKTVMVVDGYHLVSGHTLSCGCIQRERAREAKTKWNTPEELHAADIFRDMKKRCTNPKDKEYHRYGGRGITICKEWMEDRSKFVKWALDNGIEKGLEIDRINNDGNYEPTNCRFVGRTINANNKSNNRRIEIDGITHTLSEWAGIADVDYDRMQFLVNYNFQRFLDEITNSQKLQEYLKDHVTTT